MSLAPPLRVGSAATEFHRVEGGLIKVKQHGRAEYCSYVHWFMLTNGGRSFPLTFDYLCGYLVRVIRFITLMNTGLVKFVDVIHNNRKG